MRKPWSWWRWSWAARVNKDIVNLINQHGGKAVGLTGKDGNCIRAKKLLLEDKDNPGDLIDVGQVGEITQIDPPSSTTWTRAPSFRSSPRSAWARMARPTTSTPTWWPARSPRCSRRRNSFCSPTPGVLDKAGNLLTGITPKGHR